MPDNQIPAAVVEARHIIDRALRYTAEEAMDALIRRKGRIIGWRKTEAFVQMLDDALEAIAALPHLAAPAGDDADRWKAQISRYQDRLQKLCDRHGCLPSEERIDWIDRRLGELAAERDAAVLARDTAIQDTLAGVTPWLECERRMKAAETERDALTERLREALQSFVTIERLATLKTPDALPVATRLVDCGYIAAKRIATLTQASADPATGGNADG